MILLSVNCSPMQDILSRELGIQPEVRIACLASSQYWSSPYPLCWDKLVRASASMISGGHPSL